MFNCISSVKKLSERGFKKEAEAGRCRKEKGLRKADSKLMSSKWMQVRKKGKSLVSNIHRLPGIRYWLCVLIRLIYSWSKPKHTEQYSEMNQWYVFCSCYGPFAFLGDFMKCFCHRGWFPPPVLSSGRLAAWWSVDSSVAYVLVAKVGFGLCVWCCGSGFML